MNFDLRPGDNRLSRERLHALVPSVLLISVLPMMSLSGLGTTLRNQ